jgi:23S rRNA (uracil1939-C5)-methyltransferase
MDQVRITVDTLTHGPYGLGRHHGKVILVPGTAPGDVADIRITEDRKHYAVGELVSLIEPGQSRTTPPCPYAGRCGGCSWQHIDYETQLSSKEKNVADALARTAQLSGFEMLPILQGSPPYHYRRRIRLHIAGTEGIGFRRLLSHDIVPIENCLIAQNPINTHMALARQWVGELKTHLTSIEILETHDTQVVLVGRAARDFRQNDERACREFCRARTDLAGIVLSGAGWRHHWGEDQIAYSLSDGIHLRIDADAFSQVNARGNLLLLEELLTWANLREQDRVLELYSGAGNITLPIARRAGQVVAIEAHEGLVRNGRRNSRRNGLNNIEWRCQKARSGVSDLVETHDSFQTIVMNPPRSGAKDVVRNVIRLNARRIFYVACDPATMARDIGQLCELGYDVERIRPIDLFPQTHHVEVLIELRRSTERPDKP